MRDGMGNLVAMDGRLFPPVWIRFGRDIFRGPHTWVFSVHWGLKDDPVPGELVYRRGWDLVLTVVKTYSNPYPSPIGTGDGQ